MEVLKINNKELPVPSFFQVINYGGGFGDKTREVVYAELTNNAPTLLNYFYLNNKLKHAFSSPYFDDIQDYDRIGDVFNEVRKKIILEDNSKMSDYPYIEYDFNDRVLLLDSGASNIVKLIAKEVDYNIESFEKRFIEEMKNYYDFAHNLKFDIVVGFDLGGKYTFKANETKDDNLISFYDRLDKDAINYKIMVETVKYIKTYKDYYPKVLATVHGRTPEEYEEYAKKIIKLEINENYSFWGFALGGVASSSSMDDSWYKGINFKGTNKRYMKNAITPAIATKIVKKVVGNRPIHALGCGGFINIPMNYFFGATSFDAASPARRVGDGNDLSVKDMIDKSEHKGAKYSKLLLGGFNVDMEKMQGEFDYYKINDVDDGYELCGCNACIYVGYIKRLKELYIMKKTDPEAHYLSRQIMNTHSVNMHTSLCKVVSQYDSMNAYLDDNKSSLNEQLKKIYNQIK